MMNGMSVDNNYNNCGKKSVLFVCLCNICRSPTAEAVFRYIVHARNLQDEWSRIDSCGVVDWHVGEDPDERGLSVLKSKGIVDYKHKSRQITLRDFYDYHWIFTVDYSTFDRLKDLAPPNFTGRIELFGQYDPQEEAVIRDPFFDDDDSGYVSCFERCVRASNTFLDKFYEEYPSPESKQGDELMARFYHCDHAHTNNYY